MYFLPEPKRTVHPPPDVCMTQTRLEILNLLILLHRLLVSFHGFVTFCGGVSLFAEFSES